MKKLISFCIVLMMMFVACNKEQFVPEEPLTPKKAKVPVPMKADFCMTADGIDVIPVQGAPVYFPIKFFPAHGKISGHATHMHMGEIITELSYGNNTSCVYKDQGTPLDPTDDELWMLSEGRITVANGDSYAFIHSTPLIVKLNLLYSGVPILPYSGEVTMSDGTGRFEEATGTVIMVGQSDLLAGTNCWHAEGTMTYAR